MKPWLAIAITLSFLGIAVFGVFTMDPEGNHSHNGCIAATARGIDCSKREDALPFLAFHLDAFRSFSAAVFGENLGGMLLMLFLLLLTSGAAILRGLQLNPPPSDFSKTHQFLKFPAFSLQRKLVRWLALHENSPAAS